MAEPKLRQRISNPKFMLLMAALFDFCGLAALLVFGVGGTFVGIIGDLTFFLWYLILGVYLWNGRSIKRASLNFLAEFIPGFSSIYPGFLFFVYFQNKDIQREDDEYNAKIKEEAEKQKAQIVAIAQYNEHMRQKKMIDDLNNTEANSLAGEIDKQMEENHRIMKLNDVRPKEQKGSDRNYPPLHPTA